MILTGQLRKLSRAFCQQIFRRLTTVQFDGKIMPIIRTSGLGGCRAENGCRSLRVGQGESNDRNMQ